MISSLTSTFLTVIYQKTTMNLKAVGIALKFVCGFCPQLYFSTFFQKINSLRITRSRKLWSKSIWKCMNIHCALRQYLWWYDNVKSWLSSHLCIIYYAEILKNEMNTTIKYYVHRVYRLCLSDVGDDYFTLNGKT